MNNNLNKLKKLIQQLKMLQHTIKYNKLKIKLPSKLLIKVKLYQPIKQFNLLKIINQNNKKKYKKKLYKQMIRIFKVIIKAI